MSETTYKIVNVHTAGTPVIDITNLGNHVACPYCKEANKTIKILQKALELACEELENVEVFDKEFMGCECFEDYFKQQSEKELRDE